MSIKILLIESYGYKTALTGMRNPYQNRFKSDTIYDENDKPVNIGENDLKLAQKLIINGPDHSKFMRQIHIGIDVVAPLYWWKEFDTYKVATVANSESTMHTLVNNPITLDNFSFDGVLNLHDNDWVNDLITIIHLCETYRKKYIDTKNIAYWRRLIQILPEGWNQKRTVTINYATLRNIYFARKNHKLIEWQEFCNFIESIPFGKELICYVKEKNNG